MKKLVTISIGLAVLLPSAAFAAKTDQEVHVKKISKYAVSNDDLVAGKRKGKCLCQDGGALDGQVGDTVYSEVFDVIDEVFRIYLSCSVPEFDPQGAEAARSLCSTFVPLAK